MPHQYMHNKVEGTSLHHSLHRSSLNTRRLIDDVIIYYMLFVQDSKNLLLSALFEINYNILQICYFFFSSVQPIQTAIMRAELHRRGISQMRVSDCVCLE
jgi:hypothetical protein